MIRKLIGVLILSVITFINFGCVAEVDIEENANQLEKQNNLQVVEQEEISESVKNQVEDIENTSGWKSKAYKYNENDGIFVFYSTDNAEIYRKLLPEAFDMPDEMIVHLFVMDFYDINSEAEPYKEMSISLLAKYNGENVWHCIYMPVTSEQSMIAGKIGLGLPKTIGDIEFERGESIFTGTVRDDQNGSGEIIVNTSDYDLSANEKEKIRTFMSYPKINLLDGQPIQMTRAGGSVNIIDVAERYTDLVTVQGGVATITFEASEDANIHAFDLLPSQIIAAYYLHNEIPFSLDRKQ